jgi:hypothetical protein
MGFLADARQRDVLRQEGANYKFRHLELQHRLATHSEEDTQDRLPRRRRLTSLTIHLGNKATAPPAATT